MPFVELLRATVFLTAGGATALGAIAVIGAQRDQNETVLIVGVVWWLVATWIGLLAGRPERAADSMRGILARARTVTSSAPGMSLPPPGRIAWARLWPILLAVLVAGGLGIVFPEVAMVGSGYALLVALAWRNREGAVLAIEGRDGVRFLVESGSAFRPVKLLRSPGFTTF
ncbi:MAG: hypothetical protein JJE10_09360 [Thermoleophilia bacterium]|nr:hypothetical protein [Thermoleophilia bacterium]